MNTNQIFVLISKIRRDSSSFLEKEMNNIGMEGLLPSHGAILGALFQNGAKLRMKEISEITKRDKSTVTYLVNILCQFGYVTKEKGDRDSRETYITLTKKALAMEEKFNMVSQKLVTTAYSGFSDDEKQILMDLLKRIDDNFIV